MKQTRTTLKELTAMYRAVLRHGILCNAIALGLIAAPAMAYTPQDSYDVQNEKVNVTVGGTTIDGVSASGLVANGDDCGAAMSIVYSDPTDTGLTLIKNSLYDGNKALGNEADSGAFNVRLGNVRVENTKFSNNEAQTAGAIYVYTAKNSGYNKLVIDNSVFEGNIASGEDNADVENGGGAIVNVAINSKNNGDAGLWISNSSFVNNQNTKNNLNGGGAINVGSQSRTNITDTEFIVNTSASRGGAISARDFNNGKNDEAVMDIVGSVFQGNVAATTGGAIDNTLYNSDTMAGSVYVSGTTFGGAEEGQGNSALNGGAIYNHKGGTVKLNGQDQVGNMYITDSTFTGNTATANGGAIYNEGTLTVTGESAFTNNSTTTSGGGAIYNSGALTLTGTESNKVAFTGNHTTKNGGAIFAATGGSLDIDYAKFENNTATNGGAITNLGTSALTIDNSIFTGNTVATNGGAIQNNATVDAEISNTTFSGNYTGKSSTSASGSGSGGAIYNGSGKLTLTNNTFTGNGKLVDGNTETMKTGTGGAIYNNSGTLEISGGSITDNMANKAGAIYVSSGSLSIDGTEITGNASTGGSGVIWVNGGNGFTINNATIDNNSGIKNNAPIYVVEGLGLVPAGTGAAGNGGAIYNSSASGKTSTITGGSISQNVAATGGAIYNNRGILDIKGTTFNGNVASGVSVNSSVIGGGAIRNLDTLNIKDATFTNNIATQKGGAIFNAASKTITFDGSNTFSGNKSDVTWDEGNGNITASTANDIYNNMGTIDIISGAGETNTFAGGFDGVAGSKLNINGAGTTNIANALKNHTTTVNAGELHLTNADLTGSKIAVKSGATINTIDDEINDYMTGEGNNGTITLADDALVKGDIDYIAGLADTYSADSGANITYKLANALNLSGMQYGAAKEIRVTNTGATVNADANFAWYNAVDGLTLTSGGTGTGTVLVSGVAGGINAAVDATDETVQEITYSANAASETFDGADNVIQNADFSIVGNGSDANSNKIVFENDMIVDEKSTLALNDIVLEKTNDEAIVNKAGATLNIKDSRIAVNVNNYGTLVSDPTYYDAKVVNAGDATFTEDVFENGSSLTNSATVNLNNVEFVSGSTLTGLAGNVLNVAGTDNKFNGTSTGNNVVLANGAKFVGTLSDGSVDARNGGIDTITGSVSGGDLYVDANLNAGTVDTFGGTTGATVKGIKLAGTAYGDDDKVKLTIGEAALDSDVEIDGTNYFTSVVKDGNDIVFSDKLINESNLYKKLGSWTGGNYIKSNVDMANTADANHLTVGGALAALDSAVGDMSGFGSQNYAKNTGSVAANITALDSQLKTVSTEGEIASGNTGFVSGGAVYTALAGKQDTLTAGSGISLTDGTIAVSGLTTSNLAADANIAKTQLASSVQDSLALADSALQADSALNGANLTAGSVALDKLATTDLSQFDNSTSGFITKDVNDLANYTTTSDMNTAITTAKDAAIAAAATDATTKANNALAAAKEYVDGKGYQTASDVDSAMDAKITALDLENTYATKDGVENSFNAVHGEVNDAINTAAADATSKANQALTDAKDYTNTKLADYSTTADMNTAIATAKDEAIAAAATDATTKANNALAAAKEYVDGKGYQTEDDVNALISSATSGKQDAIVDNEFIVADGNGGLKVKDASVTDAHLADSAVTTAKVADGAITSDKLDSGVKDSLTKANTAVQTVTTGTANGTITVDGTEVAVAGWNTKQDTISNTSTIVKDGTGLKVADGSIGTTQLDSSVNESLTRANSAVQSVTTGTTNGTISVDGTEVEVAGLGSLAYEDAASFEAAGAAAAAEANAKAYTDARLSALHDNSVEMANAYTDRRIEDLDKNLSAGVAGAVALSAVATSGVERGEVSVGAGYGYFNGQSAAAFGATMGLSNRWSINAGAGISNADVSFRAGTNYKFKLF